MYLHVNSYKTCCISMGMIQWVWLKHKLLKICSGSHILQSTSITIIIKSNAFWLINVLYKNHYGLNHYDFEQSMTLYQLKLKSNHVVMHCTCCFRCFKAGGPFLSLANSSLSTECVMIQVSISFFTAKTHNYIVM